VALVVDMRGAGVSGGRKCLEVTIVKDVEDAIG